MHYVALWNESKYMVPKVVREMNDARIWEYYARECAEGLYL